MQLDSTGLASSYVPAEQEQEAKILKLPGSVLISVISTHAINEYQRMSLFALMMESVAQFLSEM